MYLKVLLITLRLVIAFVAALVHCREGLQSSVRYTPRSFSSFAVAISLPPNIYVVSGLSFPRCILLHFPALKRRSQVSDHTSRFSKSSCMASLPSELPFWTLLYSLVSSANNLVFDETMSGRSLTYKTKRMGPRTDPWGTPLNTSAQSDRSFLTLTCCFLRGQEILDPFQNIASNSVGLKFGDQTFVRNGVKGFWVIKIYNVHSIAFIETLRHIF